MRPWRLDRLHKYTIESTLSVETVVNYSRRNFTTQCTALDVVDHSGPGSHLFLQILFDMRDETRKFAHSAELIHSSENHCSKVQTSRVSRYETRTVATDTDSRWVGHKIGKHRPTTLLKSYWPNTTDSTVGHNRLLLPTI